MIVEGMCPDTHPIGRAIRFSTVSPITCTFEQKAHPVKMLFDGVTHHIGQTQFTQPLLSGNSRYFIPALQAVVI